MTSAYRSRPRREPLRRTVVIKKKLTKRRVTAQVPMYERGQAVPLGADPQGDPLAFERSRVAVYLEVGFPRRTRRSRLRNPWWPEWTRKTGGSRRKRW